MSKVEKCRIYQIRLNETEFDGLACYRRSIKMYHFNRMKLQTKDSVVVGCCVLSE